jgi:hypothetical protein
VGAISVDRVTEKLADEHVVGQLCPTFVCRVSGLPVDCVDNLRAPRTVGLLNSVLKLEAQLSEEKESVSDLIHARIGGLDDPKLRRMLLKGTVNLSEIHDNKRGPENRKTPYTVVSCLSETPKQAKKRPS